MAQEINHYTKYLSQFSYPAHDTLEAILNICIESIDTNGHSQADVGTEYKKVGGLIVFIDNPRLYLDRTSHRDDRWFYTRRGSDLFLPLETIDLESMFKRTLESSVGEVDFPPIPQGLVIGRSGLDGAYHIVRAGDGFHITNQKYISPSLFTYVVRFWDLESEDDLYRILERGHQVRDIGQLKSFGAGTTNAIFETIMAAMFNQGNDCYGIRFAQTIYDKEVPVGTVKITRARLKEEGKRLLFKERDYSDVMRMKEPEMNEYMTKTWNDIRASHPGLFKNGMPVGLFELEYTEIRFLKQGRVLSMVAHTNSLDQQSSIQEYHVRG